MKTVTLRRTPEEIREYNRRSEDPLGILRLINRISPRDWSFSLTFRNGDIRLAIQSDPPLSADDFMTLADGVVAELYGSKEILFSDKEDAVRCTLDPAQDKNVVTLASWPSPVDGLHLMYAGSVPSVFQQRQTFEDSLYDLTWFGSHFWSRRYSARSLRWNIFGDKWQMSPRGRDTFADGNTFECPLVDREGGNHIGQVALSFGHGASNRLYHSGFGRVSNHLDLGKCVSGRHRVRRLKLEVFAEVDENSLQYTPSGDLGPYEGWMGVKAALEDATRTLSDSKGFDDFLGREEALEKSRYAERLRQRQVQIESRPKLYMGSRMLGCVPQSENEVVLLLAKLDVLDAIPLARFSIIEYTPARGIDAIGEFQISDASAVERFVPIEVEYQFENFWAHGHAIEQVRMIVCWRFRGDGASHGSRLKRQEDWLYQYTEGPHAVWVVLLSKLPKVEQRGGTE